MGWDANVIHSYEWENNLTDEKGTLDASNAGTGPVYATDVVKYGTYSTQVTANANHAYLNGTTFSTEMALLSQFTVEMWFYSTGANAPNFWASAFVRFWYTATGCFSVIGVGGGNIFVDYNGTKQDTSLTVPAWHHISFQWIGGSTNQAKFYIDGVLKLTWNTSTNVFSVGTYNLQVGAGLYADSPNTQSRMDRLIVSNIARNGVETLPTPTGKAGIIVGKFSKSAFGTKSVGGGR